MVSTLLNYKLYAKNLPQTLDRVAAQPLVAKNADYYAANIDKVTSVDDFLADYKLYTYAMTAYGLSDQIGSKGLMRKVLESDLSDSASFANKLVDKRYREFAAAFNFSAADTKPAAQSASQTERIVEAYTERVSRSAPDAARQTGYFETEITSILASATSEAGAIDAIVGDRGVLNVALRAAGFTDPALIESSYVKSLLTTPQTNLTGPPAVLRGYLDGMATATAAQRSDRLSNVVYAYNEATGNATSPQAAQANVDYFKTALARTPPPTATQLTDDPRLVTMLQAAVGMTTTYTSDFIHDILVSPTAAANRVAVYDNNGNFLPAQATIRAQLQALNGMFKFNADGSAATSVEKNANNVDQTYNVPLPPKAYEQFFSGYLKNYKAIQTKQDSNATAAFSATIAKVKTVSDLLLNDKNPLTGLTYDPVTGVANTKRTTLDFVLKAFDLDPKTESLSKIRAALTSDPSDPASYVSRLKDERYSKLAAAFNFGSDGAVQGQRVIQSTDSQTKMATLYSATFGTNQSAATKSLASADTKAYLETINGIYSIDGFLAETKAVQYALKAYGVENKNLSKADLRKILTSDLSDPKSFANASADPAVAKFAAAFNFETDGSVADAGSGLQSNAAKRTTDNLYLLQSLEEQAGETSEGTRLALYFLRNAPNVTTAYGILADKALYQVVQTAFALPAGMSNMDVAAQAKILDSRIDFKDFADPKKLDKFIGRFAAMYDLNNADASSSSILSLFTGSSSGSGLLSLF
ncbi:DUF1217 domain-containing protein [Aureimonas pseudogalii]|uniref:DUF1217 domain-containing protein n=1 Tax=Aureimonas pseudogalii TaxID=1744844 RepID=A0A7W6H291_9HYPH|nr:DUF1217 domain-containing protein [Aureimonas pseudogalii]MBB3996380.1 hypothetical protein [Aureimonas pseudogalii]